MLELSPEPGGSRGRSRAQVFCSLVPPPRLGVNASVTTGFLPTCHFPHEVAADTESVISAVTAELPVDFPEHISNAIFDGLSSQSAKILKGVAK